jgi:transposase
MNTREERGVVIAAVCKLTYKNGFWIVPSQSHGDKKYMVDLDRNACSCPDHMETGFVCKHQFAAKIVMRREMPDGRVIEQRTFAFTERRVYKRNWSAYNESQTVEKDRFQVLLADLCSGVPNAAPKSNKGGRPRVKTADRVFAATYKVYSTLSTRRFSSDLKAAARGKHISRPVHYNAVSHFMEEPDLEPVFKSLISRSAQPLRSLESAFAVDSTGFTSARHVRWFDHKYGVERTGHDWCKAHVATGTATNVVTAAAIYGRDTNDCPILPELVKRTKDEGFWLKEVSADKGYLSVENVEAIHDAGATPFIAFKSSTTGAAGGLFEKMFHYYQFNQAEYMDHYHKRSKIESVFSAVKRKFDGHLRSRTDQGMRNEVYCKLLCHNLCCVIRSQVELGIEATFWPEAA